MRRDVSLTKCREYGKRKRIAFTISYCADTKRPIPATKQRLAMKTAWLDTPRKPIIESVRVMRVVAKAPNPSGLWSVSVNLVQLHETEICWELTGLARCLLAIRDQRFLYPYDIMPIRLGS